MVHIKILGTGCPKCRRLKQKVQGIIEKYGLEARIEEITDIDQMLNYGYMITPGLVINGNLKCAGYVPDEKNILRWIQEESAVSE